MGGMTMRTEQEWLDEATAAAVAGARRIAAGIKGKPVDQLDDQQWGWVIAAVIIGWIQIRMQQAISEGRDAEEVVRLTTFSPDPCDVAVVHSILPTLADQAGIDWALSLSSWPKDVMTNFLL